MSEEVDQQLVNNSEPKQAKREIMRRLPRKRLQSGLYALMKMRKAGRPNGRTHLGKAFDRRRYDYIEMYGGDPSPAEMNLIIDTVWIDLYILSCDMELVGVKRLHRGGKVHPLLDIRVKLAAHRRQNLQLMGLKRVMPPPKSLADWQAEIETEQTDQDEEP